MSNRVEIKTVGKGYDAEQIVFLDGEKQRSFSHVSDDYAFHNAEEYAKELRSKIKKEQTNG